MCLYHSGLLSAFQTCQRERKRRVLVGVEAATTYVETEWLDLDGIGKLRARPAKPESTVACPRLFKRLAWRSHLFRTVASYTSSQRYSQLSLVAMTLGVRQVGATVLITPGPVRLALTGDPSNGPSSQCATRAFRIPRTDAAATTAR
ncbi:hypothetical protein MRX96_003935 [Rhipicephalus microplus]